MFGYVYNLLFGQENTQEEKSQKKPVKLEDALNYDNTSKYDIDLWLDESNDKNINVHVGVKDFEKYNEFKKKFGENVIGDEKQTDLFQVFDESRVVVFHTYPLDSNEILTSKLVHNENSCLFKHLNHKLSDQQKYVVYKECFNRINNQKKE